MPPRRPVTRAPNLLRDVHPLFTIGAAVAGIVAWSFNTFAQLSYVREQNNNLTTLIEQRHKDAIEHSDQNFQQMVALMEGIKNSLQNIERRLDRGSHP